MEEPSTVYYIKYNIRKIKCIFIMRSMLFLHLISELVMIRDCIFSVGFVIGIYFFYFFLSKGIMEMSHHQFCLKWNNHSSNLLKVFGRLFSNESFTDVTLAAEGRSIRAHKVVHLSPFSFLDRKIKRGKKKNIHYPPQFFYYYYLFIFSVPFFPLSPGAVAPRLPNPLLAENR